MNNLDDGPRLKLDPWAASSLLQKAIRRGDGELAKYAAQTLYRQRGKSIWRRLVTIAFEDVGIGDPELVSELTFLATDKNLRAMIGDDADLILDLCQRLAEAPKDRSTDYLFCAATRLAAWQQERARLTSMDIGARIAIAADPDQPLIRRGVATLLSCTINGEGSQMLRDGALPQLIASLQNDCPSPLHNAVIQAAQKPVHPFILMLPLLWSAQSREGAPPEIVVDPVPPAEFLGGIPLYTFDKHTRIGKQAISRLANENREVRDLLAEHVPDFVARDVALMAAFYADAMPVSRRHEWGQSRSLEALGLEADMTFAGCPKAGITPIVECIRRNLDHLNDLRRSILLRRA